MHGHTNIKFKSSRLRLKCDGTRAKTRFRLSVKRTRPFKSAGASVQSTTGSRGVNISGSNAGYTMFRGSVKGTGYPTHSPVSPSLPLPCVTVCHHISIGLYAWMEWQIHEQRLVWKLEGVIWICGRRDLTEILKKQGSRVWTVFIMLIMEISGKILQTQ